MTSKTHTKAKGEDIFAAPPPATITVPPTPAVTTTSTTMMPDYHPPVKPDASNDYTGTVIMFFAMCFIMVYFFPTMIAALRRHRNLLALFLSNLFFGWTFIGWVCTLIWACTATQRDYRTA